MVVVNIAQEFTSTREADSTHKLIPTWKFGVSQMLVPAWKFCLAQELVLAVRVYSSPESPAQFQKINLG